MANGRTFLTEIALIAGINMPAAEKLAGPLRQAGFVPRSGRGTASNSVHLFEGPATYLLLALAAPGPSTVLSSVKAFSTLQPAHPDPGDFGDLFHVMLAELGIRASRIFN